MSLAPLTRRQMLAGLAGAPDPFQNGHYVERDRRRSFDEESGLIRD